MQEPTAPICTIQDPALKHSYALRFNKAVWIMQSKNEFVYNLHTHDVWIM